MGLLSALGDALSLGYNIYAGERNFSYQRQLNQQIMNREDNAVSRRAADLQRAGLHPTLAAGGSGAASAPMQSVSPSEVRGNPAMASAQVDNIRANTNLANAQARAANAEATVKAKDILARNIDLNYRDQQQQLGVDIQTEDYNQRHTANQYQEAMLQLSMYNTTVGIQQIQQNIKESVVRTHKMDYEIQVLTSQFHLNSAQEELIKRQSLMLQKELQYISENHGQVKMPVQDIVSRHLTQSIDELRKITSSQNVDWGKFGTEFALLLVRVLTGR